MEQLKSPIEDHQWSCTLNEEETFMAQLFNTTVDSADDPFMAAASFDINLHDQDQDQDQAADHPYIIETPNSFSSTFYSQLSQDDHNHHHQSCSEFSGGSYSSQLLLFPTHENNNYYTCSPLNFEADQFMKLPQELAAMEELEEARHDHHLEINCKKRSRGSKDKRSNERSKKTQKLTSSTNTEEDGNIAGHSRQSTSCNDYCSEDESNASLELNGGANNLGSSPKGPTKSRASRGSATDPQSLYARRRRERINERLRILQKLVPNGTKVDISTMLEEAVEYVKFLQLQIKLLSSDDLWMYAPIAYNGMDIGLNSTPKSTPKEL